MSGTPFVLLHGFAGDVADWTDVKKELGQTRLYTLPLFGHRGRAEQRESSFDTEVDRLAGTLSTHGLERAHLVGYSLGGRLALGLLARHPALFSQATLIGAQPGLSAGPLREERRKADDHWVEILEGQGLDPFFLEWQAQPLFASQNRFPERVAARQARLRGHHHAKGLAQAMRALGLANMPDLRPQLVAVATPVRLIAGELDQKFTQIADELVGLLPQSERNTIPSCGHNPLLEQPAALAALLMQPPPGRKTT